MDNMSHYVMAADLLLCCSILIIDIILVSLEISNLLIRDVKTVTFEIHRDQGIFVVTGAGMDRLIDSVNFDDQESLNWFHRTLRRLGVIDALRQAGAQEGSVVRIAEMEFDFVE